MKKTGPKPKAEAELRRHSISFRVTDAELAVVDSRRGTMTRGRWIRTAALGKLPRFVPEVNRNAWADLARAVSNLNQLARAINQGVRFDAPAAVISEVKEMVQALRRELLEGTDESES